MGCEPARYDRRESRCEATTGGTFDTSVALCGGFGGRRGRCGGRGARSGRVGLSGLVERINRSGEPRGKLLGGKRAVVDERLNESVPLPTRSEWVARDQKWGPAEPRGSWLWFGFRRAEGRLKHAEELRCSSVDDSWNTICCGRAAKHRTGRCILGEGPLVESGRRPKKRSDGIKKGKKMISKKARG